ncbi:MAG TPA: class I SAM-dependent methyltransferase [Acidimicrobiales bacterium]|nr:class I SAM-dependent methyltransferase [Acidimicrobiales bacterium]
MNDGRARSFGEVAEAYDRYRPGPPAEAAAWVLPAEAADVLDVGAGTGAFTRRLVGRVSGQVVAAEPDGRMRRVLADRSPGVVVVGATAEYLPFAAASFGAVVVSSAWHWVDATRAVPEIARVLRPGGHLAVLWSGPDRRVDWVADVLGRGRDAMAGAEQEDHRHQVELPAGAPFGPAETTTLTWTMPMTRHELVGLAATYSQVIVLSPGERASLLDRVADLAARLIPLGGPAAIDVPMRCRCWRAARWPAP